MVILKMSVSPLGGRLVPRGRAGGKVLVVAAVEGRQRHPHPVAVRHLSHGPTADKPLTDYDFPTLNDRLTDRRQACDRLLTDCRQTRMTLTPRPSMTFRAARSRAMCAPHRPQISDLCADVNIILALPYICVWRITNAIHREASE